MGISKIGSSLTDSYTEDAARSAAQVSDESFAGKLEAAVQNNDDKELKKACQEFEGIMLDILYRQMKSTIIKSDLIEKDAGTEIFESMRDEALVEQAAQTGSLGLAVSLYRQLSGNSGAGIKNVHKEAIQENKEVAEKKGE